MQRHEFSSDDDTPMSWRRCRRLLDAAEPPPLRCRRLLSTGQHTPKARHAMPLPAMMLFRLRASMLPMMIFAPAPHMPLYARS